MTGPDSSVGSGQWRIVFGLGVGVLIAACLLALALRTSANPVPGDMSYDAIAWVQDVLTMLGAVLLGAALTLWQLGQ